MLVILSQKVDSKSDYMDEPFLTYHYPARYRNQLRKGDVFIYYQGNRFDTSQRYYFGVGRIGEILTTDGVNYYAKLIDCQRFEQPVPIYLPDGGYIEQLGYEDVRQSLLPPWQSSVRPLSQKAYDYILNTAGVRFVPQPVEDIEVFREKLRNAVRAYYVGKDSNALFKIESLAATLSRIENIAEPNPAPETLSADPYQPAVSGQDKLAEFIQYCRDMKMSYSYKAILILALLHKCDSAGQLPLEKAIAFFRKYYSDRQKQGLCIEKKQCIYLKPDVTDKQIAANLISNPVRVLVESGFFFFNSDTQMFSISPEIWNAIDKKSKTLLIRICGQRLKTYYSE